MAKVMMNENSISHKFWAMIVNIACHVINNAC